MLSISFNRCPVSVQYVLLIAFLIHFVGVLSEPLRFFSRSEVQTAPEIAFLSETMKPYSQFLYMNHGYFFFAPNPGPGHLIQCSPSTSSAVDSATESSSQNFYLPDRKDHWPRLLYHRYFMLSEFYTSRYAPQQVTEELKKDIEFMPRWAFDKELYDQIRTSIVISLKHSRGHERIELRRVERLLPDAQQVLKEGWNLNDPSLMAILPETMIETALPELAKESSTINVLPSKANAGVSR